MLCEAHRASSSGRSGSEDVGLSNVNIGGNPMPRKPKGCICKLGSSIPWTYWSAFFISCLFFRKLLISAHVYWNLDLFDIISFIYMTIKLKKIVVLDNEYVQSLRKRCLWKHCAAKWWTLNYPTCRKKNYPTRTIQRFWCTVNVKSN